MNCPTCSAPPGPADLTCPACGEVLLALPNGTSLYQRYRVLRPLRRTDGISYLAEDDQQRQVLMLEFFPPGSRRLGTLAVLPEDSATRRQVWLSLLHARSGLAGPGVQRPQVIFEQHGTAYTVTALPLGEPLATHVRPGPGHTLSPEEAYAMLSDLAHGLEEVQRLGGHDGHLEPSRVSLTPAGARLDLGWARDAQAAYLAPEQLFSPPRSGPASDVYALAALTLFALTGEEPPTAGQRGLGQPLPVLPAGLPVVLGQVLDQGLALQTQHRLPHATALLRLLKGPGSRSTTTPADRPGVQVIPAHQSWLTHVHTDGQRVVTAGADLRVRVFDPYGGAVQMYDGLGGRPTGLAINDAGITIGDDTGSVTVWGGRQRPQVHTGRWGFSQLVGRPGHRAVTLQEDGALGLWDLQGPEQRGQLSLQGGRISCIHVSESDALLFGTTDGCLHVFDESVLLPVRLWQHPEQRTITAISASPTDPGLYAAVTGPQVTLIRPDQDPFRLKLPEELAALTFSPDGAALVLAGRSGGLHLADLATGQHQRLHQFPSSIRAVSWAAALLVAGTEAGQLLIIPPPQHG